MGKPFVKLLTILTISLHLLMVACNGGDEPEIALATATAKPTELVSTPPSNSTQTQAPLLPTATPFTENTPVVEQVEKIAEDDTNGETSTKPSLMNMDIERAPGHTLGYEYYLEPNGTHEFLFLASPGDTIGVKVSSAANMLVGIVNAKSGEVLDAMSSSDGTLVVDIPQNALYHIVIEDAGGQGGDYTAVFEASPKVSFALDANYSIIGRLPEGGLLYYTYTAPAGATLRGNVIPHPDTLVDLVVTIRDLDSQAVLSETNNSTAGENEQFTFAVPDDGDGKLRTFIVSVEDVDREQGAYVLVITSDDLE